MGDERKVGIGDRLLWEFVRKKKVEDDDGRDSGKQRENYKTKKR